MSWETLIVGSLEFKEGVSEAETARIINDLEITLEAKIKWDDKWAEYTFQDVNWTSHIGGSEIKKAVEKNKSALKRFECSVFYLSEADEQINLEPNSDEIEAIVESAR